MYTPRAAQSPGNGPLPRPYQGLETGCRGRDAPSGLTALAAGEVPKGPAGPSASQQVPAWSQTMRRPSLSPPTTFPGSRPDSPGAQSPGSWLLTCPGFELGERQGAGDLDRETHPHSRTLLTGAPTGPEGAVPAVAEGSINFPALLSPGRRKRYETGQVMASFPCSLCHSQWFRLPLLRGRRPCFDSHLANPSPGSSPHPHHAKAF